MKTFASLFLMTSLLFFGCKPKDTEVQAKVTQKFATTPGLAGVSATVKDGVATLTGK